MKNKIIESVILAFATLVVTFIGNIFLNYFFNDDSLVRIGSASKIEENHYIIPINIVTYKQGLNNVSIGLKEDISESQINSDKPINIELVKSNVGKENGTMIKIKEIPNNIKVQLIVSVKNPISDKDIEVHGNNIVIEKLSEIENPVTSLMKNLVISSVVYALIMGVMNYRSSKRREEQISIVNSTTEHLRKEIENRVKEKEEINLTIKNYEKELQKKKNDSLRKQILLHARLNDYSKELSFWRNTIRKVLYQLPSGEERANQLINVVTSSLKTYQTREKDEIDFETIKVLSKMIKDIDDE